MVGYSFMTDLKNIVSSNPLEDWGGYDEHFKIGGVKITIDGSPQGKTAFFSEPNLTGSPGGEEDWRGDRYPCDQLR